MLRVTAIKLLPRKLTLGLVGGIALIGLVWDAWPRPTGAETEVLQAYAQLDQSPVPVKLVGWIVPSNARVQLMPGGYSVSVHAERLGDLTISGRHSGAPDTKAAIRWQEGDVTYTVETTADSRVVQPRVVSLEQAQRQLTGSAVDSPVLFLGYLPIFVLFTAWVTMSLLLGPASR